MAGSSKTSIGRILARYATIALTAGIAGIIVRVLYPMAPNAAATIPKATVESPDTPEEFLLASPIITNLADSTATWIRLDVAYLLRGPISPHDTNILSIQLNEDTLAFLRTLHLRQLEGSTGLFHLKEDLTDRARTRSDGRVQNVLIRSMVVQ